VKSAFEIVARLDQPSIAIALSIEQFGSALPGTIGV
jgi:hypothetical protein